MDERQVGALRFVAAQLVFVVAILHLGIGLVEWFRWLSVGFLLPRTVRWPLFVFAGVAVIAGMARAWRAERMRPWYLAGVATMLAFVAAYFLWHLAGHRPFFMLGQSPVAHDLTVEFVLAHYLDAGPFEFISVTVELLAAALLAVLYVVTDE